MTGVVGLGQRALAGRQGPDVAARAAAFDQLGMQVTPANVLGVYGVVMEEVERLKSAVIVFQTRSGQGMGECGRDPVSPAASIGFTRASGQLLEMCQGDVSDLQRVGAGLAEAARAY